ncbi:MAG: methyltransferase domain-containing protein [Deltaproteobacteria bacterium]|nr:methyltransferase domain-containing protein [Deltaproteobacteria bacterium]
MTPAAPTWDDAETARAYQAFTARHDRYRTANAALVRAARIAPSHRVLDVGAGIGGTAAAALARLGGSGRVVCVEPSAAMRRLGRAEVADPRVVWRARVPRPAPAFDRVLCGASIWLMGALDATIARLAARLAPGGALAFDVPAAYVGVPDTPRVDPLGAIAAWLAGARMLAPAPLPPAVALPDPAGVERLLAAAGLRARRWSMRARLTQAAYRDWLAIPVVSAGMLGGVDAAERARRLDAALAHVDAAAWRRETWIGWTAWKS